MDINLEGLFLDQVDLVKINIKQIVFDLRDDVNVIENEVRMLDST